jgi:DsbC/DsbD-like thiol-disulfide interchange protein
MAPHPPVGRVLKDALGGFRGTVTVGLLCAALAWPCRPLHGQRIPEGAITVRAESARPSGAPGDRLTIAVTIEYAPGFHSWPDEPVVPPELGRLRPIPTTIDLTPPPEGLALEAVDWPQPTSVTVHYTGRPLALLSYTDTVVASVQLRVAADARTGSRSVTLTVGYQVCDERVCYRPTSVERTVRLQVESHWTGVVDSR